MDTIKISVDIEFPKEHVAFVALNQCYTGDNLSQFASDYIKKVLVETLSAPFIANAQARIALATDTEVSRIKKVTSEGITTKPTIDNETNN